MGNAKKKALGKGLGAILSSPETDITSKDISGNYVVGAVADLAIKNIETNPFQPRDVFDEKALQELAKSIKEQGIIQPITVRKLGYEKYQIISGERRFRASKIAGLEKIPAYIRVANDEQMLQMALVENIQRQDLNAIEIAISYQRLMEECDLSKEELGGVVGKNRTTVTNYLRLLSLPAEIQAALMKEEINMGQAKPLVTLDEEELQLALLHEILSENLSARKVEQRVKEINEGIKIQDKEEQSKKLPKGTLPSQFRAYQHQLSDKFEAKIKIKRTNNGRGTIAIPFRSDKDFERILELLNLDY